MVGDTRLELVTSCMSSRNNTVILQLLNMYVAKVVAKDLSAYLMKQALTFYISCECLNGGMSFLNTRHFFQPTPYRFIFCCKVPRLIFRCWAIRLLLPL